MYIRSKKCYVVLYDRYWINALALVVFCGFQLPFVLGRGLLFFTATLYTCAVLQKSRIELLQK